MKASTLLSLIALVSGVRANEVNWSDPYLHVVWEYVTVDNCVAPAPSSKTASDPTPIAASTESLIPIGTAFSTQASNGAPLLSHPSKGPHSDVATSPVTTTASAPSEAGGITAGPDTTQYSGYTRATGLADPRDSSVAHVSNTGSPDPSGTATSTTIGSVRSTISTGSAYLADPDSTKALSGSAAEATSAAPQSASADPADMSISAAFTGSTDSASATALSSVVGQAGSDPAVSSQSAPESMKTAVTKTETSVSHSTAKTASSQWTRHWGNASSTRSTRTLDPRETTANASGTKGESDVTSVTATSSTTLDPQNSSVPTTSITTKSNASLVSADPVTTNSSVATSSESPTHTSSINPLEPLYGHRHYSSNDAATQSPTTVPESTNTSSVDPPSNPYGVSSSTAPVSTSTSSTSSSTIDPPSPTNSVRSSSPVASSSDPEITSSQINSGFGHKSSVSDSTKTASTLPSSSAPSSEPLSTTSSSATTSLATSSVITSDTSSKPTSLSSSTSIVSSPSSSSSTSSSVETTSVPPTTTTTSSTAIRTTSSSSTSTTSTSTTSTSTSTTSTTSTTPTTSSSMSSSITTSSSSAAPISTLSSYQQTILDYHNKVRSEHSAGPMVWNDTIAQFAEDYLSKVAQPSECTFEHSGGPYGENMALGYPTALSGMEAWYNEYKDYNYTAGEFSEQTGHFTQMVWKGSTSVGCYTKNCGSYDSPFFICEYYPRGNIIGYFKENVLES